MGWMVSWMVSLTTTGLGWWSARTSGGDAGRGQRDERDAGARGRF